MHPEPRKLARVLFDEAHGESWTVSAERAREMQPENAANSSYQRAADLQVDLFAAPAAQASAPPSAVDDALTALDPDSLTPREALEALYRLKQLSKTSP